MINHKSVTLDHPTAASTVTSGSDYINTMQEYERGIMREELTMFNKELSDIYNGIENREPNPPTIPVISEITCSHPIPITASDPTQKTADVDPINKSTRQFVLMDNDDVVKYFEGKENRNARRKTIS